MVLPVIIFIFSVIITAITNKSIFSYYLISLTTLHFMVPECQKFKI